MGKQKEAMNLPFMSKDDTVEGFEEISSATMAIPFVKVLQSLSPQLNRNEPGYIPEAEEGMFFNTVTKQLFRNTIKVIVLKFERVFIEWLPERGGFLNYHSPENAERLAVDKTFGKWKTVDGNSLQENYVYFVLIVGRESEGVIVLSLSSTFIKIAKEWNRLMTTHIMDNGERAKPYYVIWKLKTEYQTNDKGNWYTFKVAMETYINEKQHSLIVPERKALPTRQMDYAQIEDSTAKGETAEEEKDTKVPY